MAFLYKEKQPISEYLARRKNLYSQEGWKNIADNVATSTTVYVGNISFTTTEEELFALFSRISSVKKVILGIDRYHRSPCGFAFVIYYIPEDAKEAIKILDRTKLNNRMIRVDMDPGFTEGRQFGRGRHGGQVREEHRSDYDSQRGGWGHADATRGKRKRPFRGRGRRGIRPKRM